jgi:hypothetical protein
LTTTDRPGRRPPRLTHLGKPVPEAAVPKLAMMLTEVPQRGQDDSWLTRTRAGLHCHSVLRPGHPLRDTGAGGASKCPPRLGATPNWRTRQSSRAGAEPLGCETPSRTYPAHALSTRAWDAPELPAQLRRGFAALRRVSRARVSGWARARGWWGGSRGG